MTLGMILRITKNIGMNTDGGCMFRRLKFWMMRKKTCRCCCLTCKYYAECRRELLED